jgi:hypothetical protein
MKLIVSIALIIFLYSCNARNDQSAPKEILVELVKTYYDAQSENDTFKLGKMVADNFIGFEDGEMTDRKNLLNAANNLPHNSKSNFENVNAHIDKEYASMYYTRNTEYSLQSNGIDSTSSNLSFLESATFLKQNGEWRIRFLHSTLRK